MPTGVYAINPLSGERVPIWVTNYVLAEYGTGAVMGVPAHDDRDFDFAKTFDLPIAHGRRAGGPVRRHPRCGLYVDDGVLIASGEFTGLDVGRRAHRDHDETRSRWAAARQTINFRFRDWLISRQRYWGTPIPMLYCENDGMVAGARRSAAGGAAARRGVHGPGFAARQRCRVHESDLPDMRRAGISAIPIRWIRSSIHRGTTCVISIRATAARRSTTRRASAWMPVDQYIGGAEHAVMHLLYARFFYKFMVDAGYIDASDDEPFTRLFNQGTLLAQRREDVEEQAATSSASMRPSKRTASTRCGCSCSRPRRPRMRSNGPTRGSSAACASSSACGARANRLRRPPETTSLDALPVCAATTQRALVRALHLALKSAKRRNRDAALPLQRHDRAARRAGESADRPRCAIPRIDARSCGTLHRARVTTRARAVRPAHRGRSLWQRMGHATSVHVERWSRSGSGRPDRR